MNLDSGQEWRQR